MPPNTATLRVGPYFLSLLLVLVAAFGLVFLPGQRHTPKLGLDLEGGAQVTLQAQTPNGKTPNQSAMKVARQILEHRVNAKGVSAAQVYQQSTNQIVIAVPNSTSQKVAKVGQAAKLNFRPLIFAAVPNTTPTPTATSGASVSPGASGSAGTTGSSATSTTAPPTGSTTTGAKTSAPTTTGSPGATTSASPNGLVDPNRAVAAAAKTTAAATTPTAARATAAKTTAGATATPATPAPSASAASTAQSPDPFKNLGFALPKSDTAFDALTAAQQAALKAALANFDCSARPTDVPTAPLPACDNGTPPTAKYLLGPVIVAGTEISSADAVAPSANGNTSWTVSINLKSKGQTAWTDFTGAHHSGANTDNASTCSAATTPCADYVGFTLDGAVIGSPPQTESTINGTTQVEGNFSESYAKDLANDLKYGALPLNFRQLTQQDVSPTLGSSQLKAGLLAGGIGLILVVIYSFLYYRGLGFVTVASLLVSGALTYAALVILGREIGFTLTLAGIAGFIVAVGITADSFVVLFERLKDEVHSGRSLRVAVPRAWTRARRTILSADTVSFIAAAVLYYFTVGDVRGFAFTLGLSTLLDLVVVFLFTHPLVSLLSRSRAFGSPRFTGLDSVRAGGIAPSPEAPTRSARARRTRAAGGATALGGSVALLEREDEADDLGDPEDDAEGFAEGEFVDPDTADHDIADPDIADHGTDQVARARPAKPRDADADSGAPRRSRVVPRSAPPSVIGADAAERAAARRGRTVRPAKPIEDEPEHDESIHDAIHEDAIHEDPIHDEPEHDEPIDDDAIHDEPALDVDGGVVEVPADDVAPEETGPVVAPVAEDAQLPAPDAPVQFPVPARAGTSTAAERAAGRRQAGRSQPVRGSRGRREADAGAAELSPTQAPASAEPTPPPREPEPVAESAHQGTARGMNDADPPAGKATAAERAAARRDRIRSRAGHPIDTDPLNTDSEDES